MIDEDHQIVVLYHGSCPDGFGAAYAFWKKFGHLATYIPVTHGKPPPDNLENKEVYVIDFSYKREIIQELKAKVKNLVIIDHHITAQEDLEGLNFCHFDMKHSGAVLAWQYCFNSEPPKLLKYIEDRDLWLWKQEHAEQILSAVDSYPLEFQAWEKLDSMMEDTLGFASLLREGKAILRYKDFLINRILKYKYHTVINGKEVPIVNAPFFQSEIGALMAKESDFAAVYYYDGEKYIFSLRSSDDGDDVADVATSFGGGGHKKASGFSTTDLKIVHGNKKQ